MREVHTGWLWAGAAACALAGALLHTMHLWATGEPLQLVLAVGFWFVMSMASALAVLALRVGVLVPPPGGVPRAKVVLVGALASVLGIAFVLGATARTWGIFTAAPVAVGFMSLAVDALLGAPSFAAALGAAGAAESLRYSWPATAGRLRRLYADLAARAPVACG